MKRFAIVLLGMTLCSLFSNSARADWHSFWDRVHLDFHRMNAYPQPFNEMDRRATALPIAIMTNNGWRMQNTVGHELFHPETQQLTRAGELKVHWIMTQAPEPRRTVYVLRGNNSSATSVRMQSVERAVANMTMANTQSPDVVLTGQPPRGGSGEYYDRIRRGYEASTPSPRLPGGDGGN